MNFSGMEMKAKANGSDNGMKMKFRKGFLLQESKFLFIFNPFVKYTKYYMTGENAWRKLQKRWDDLRTSLRNFETVEGYPPENRKINSEMILAFYESSSPKQFYAHFSQYNEQTRQFVSQLNQKYIKFATNIKTYVEKVNCPLTPKIMSQLYQMTEKPFLFEADLTSLFSEIEHQSFVVADSMKKKAKTYSMLFPFVHSLVKTIGRFRHAITTLQSLDDEDAIIRFSLIKIGRQDIYQNIVLNKRKTSEIMTKIIDLADV